MLMVVVVGEYDSNTDLRRDYRTQITDKLEHQLRLTHEFMKDTQKVADLLGTLGKEEQVHEKKSGSAKMKGVLNLLHANIYPKSYETHDDPNRDTDPALHCDSLEVDLMQRTSEVVNLKTEQYTKFLYFDGYYVEQETGRVNTVINYERGGVVLREVLESSKFKERYEAITCPRYPVRMERLKR